MSRPTFVIIFLCSIVTLLVLIKTGLSIYISSLDHLYVNEERAIQEASAQNLLIRNRILERQSFVSLSTQAKKEGYVPQKILQL